MGEVDIDTALDWRGRTVVDRAGEKIGTMKDIYLDERERPHWASVHTGLFGMRETLVPLGQAQLEQEVLRLPYDRDHVKDAPNMDPDVQLTEDEELALFRHYGLDSSSADRPAETPAVAEAQGARASDASAEADEGRDEAMTRGEAGPSSADRSAETGAVAAGEATEGSDASREPGEPRDDAMTRSEEEVHFRTQRRERGRARLRKYVVTDYVEKKVPVQREEVRLEFEPAEGARRGGEPSASEVPRDSIDSPSEEGRGHGRPGSGRQ